MNKQHRTDVVILGGGVIGSALAYFLRKAGIDITLIERAEIAAESSSAAAGLLSPLGALEEAGPFTELLMASRALLLKLMPELEALSGESMEYRRCGSLRTASDEQESARLRGKMAFWTKLGWQVDWLSGDEARQREPQLASTVQGAVYAEQEGSIRAAGVTRAYAGAARRLGARILEHTEVTGLEHTGSRVLSVRTAGGETIACERLVIAAGAWSRKICGWLNLELPVEPARGQILALKQPATPLKHILFGRAVYLIPKPDQTIFVGATVEHVGFDKQNTAAGISWLLTEAIELVPALAEAPVARLWAGLRPWSADGRPVLGKAPGWENVMLTTGHSGVGFESSAITGQALTELLTTGETSPIIRPFGVERFAKQN
jgi:glycine oxidase